MKNRLGVYIHWPYCISKCPYCDFNSHKLEDYNPIDWLTAYKNQIKYFKEYLITQNFKNKRCPTCVDVAGILVKYCFYFSNFEF